MKDPLNGRYVLECMGPDCHRTQVTYLPFSLGLKVGDKAPTNVGDPSCGRCFKCSNHSLRVLEVPAPPPLEKPKGFTKIPTK